MIASYDIENMINSEYCRGSQGHSTLSDRKPTSFEAFLLRLIKGEELVPIMIDDSTNDIGLTWVKSIN